MASETESVQIPSSLSDQLSPQAFTEIVNVNTICRVCGSQGDRLLDIFSEDCVANELPSKLNLYLPIKISEEDILPLQVCWTCATTVLTWHELVVTSAEIDKKLRSYRIIINDKPDDIDVENEMSNEETTVEATSDMAVSSTGERIQSFSESHPMVNNLIDKYTKEFALVTTDSDSIEDQSQPQNEYIQQTLHSDEMHDSVLNKDDITSETATKEDSQEYFASFAKREEAVEQFKFGCLYCPQVFDTESDIRNHLRDQHPDIIIDFGNENKDLSEIISVSKYNKTCEEIENEQVRRQLSKERIRKNNKIDLEMVNAAKMVAGNKVYYNCKICGKSLHSPYTYVWHMRIHTGERPYVCDLCGKQFRVSQGLVRHLKETHARIKKFACDLCNRYFATKRNVEEHRRIHTNERPYVCDLCGKSFKQKASLFVHNRSHTNVFPFECNYCKATFRTKPLLNGHLTKHTGEKPYPCEDCGRQFRIKYELKRHKLIHSEEKPFLCTLCQTNFRQKRYLRNHLKFNHQGHSLQDTSEGCIIIVKTGMT